MKYFGSKSTDSNISVTSNNCLQAGRYQMGSSGGVAVSITAYIKNYTTARKAKCLIYDSNDNLIANGVTDERTLEINTAKHHETFYFSGTKPILLPNAYYYLVFWCEQVAGACSLWNKTTTGSGIFSYSRAYNTPPANVTPWTIFDADGAPRIYCEYRLKSDHGTPANTTTWKIEKNFGDKEKKIPVRMPK